MASYSKYLKVFDNHSDYIDYTEDAMILPNVSHCINEDDVHYNPLYNNDYLTFVALEDGTFTFNGSRPSVVVTNTLSYSLDNGKNWTSLASGVATPVITEGSKIMWKGNNAETIHRIEGIGTFSSSGRYNVQGKPTSLLYGDDFWKNETLQRFCFMKLFMDSTKLVNARNIKLDFETLTAGCYQHMFRGCTSLVTAPTLPATTLIGSCYSNMFNGCTSLVIAPELPATTLANNCYQNMFNGCTSLKTAPQLPATTLTDNCYSNMFQGCTSLTTASEIPATVVATNCCQFMFDGCINLVSGPTSLPATTLESGCYQYMFRYCKNLTTAIALPATTLASYCYYYMFYNTPLLPDTSHMDFASVTMVSSGGFRGLFGGTNVTDANLETILPKDGNNKYCLPVTDLSNANGCYSHMFYNCTKLVTPPKLPATTLEQYCYEYMFCGCTNLEETPELPATTLASGCYSFMLYDTRLLPDITNIDFTSLTIVSSGGLRGLFAGTNVTDANLETILPKDGNNKYCLPVTTLSPSCYGSMFEGCRSLVTAPKLPAVILTQSCYSKMFTDCKALTVPPELNATTLASGCYASMFSGCTALTTAPDLPATTLVNSCYNYMFNGCFNLNYIKAMFTTTPSSTYMEEWVSNVASSGTFVKNSAAPWSNVFGISAIPNGWTVQTA